MKKIFLFSLLAISIKATAQKKISRNTPIIQKGFYLSFNPHSIIEPEQGGVGLGIGYRISKRTELWTEFNYLYKGFFDNDDNFKNLSGFRSITSFKYYYNNKLGFFIGAEFRIKNYSFTDKFTFINAQINDTLVNFKHTANHTVTSGGVFWGKRLKLTANGKFELEGNVGVGIRQRRISRKNIPLGYSKMEYSEGVFKLRDNNKEDATPYNMGIIRIIYHL